MTSRAGATPPAGPGPHPASWKTGGPLGTRLAVAGDRQPDLVLLDLVAVDLAVRRRLLLEAARRVRHGADPEAIHDLRVSCRRLAAAHRVWRGLLRPRASRRVQRLLRAIRQRAGEARDREVLIEQLKRRARATPGVVGEALQDEARRLERGLSGPQRAVVERIGADRMNRLDREGRRSEEPIHEAMAGARILPGRHGGLADAALALAARRGRAAAEAWRAALEAPNDALVHEARIRVKKWRYALECLEAAGSAGMGARLGRLRDLQRVLGDLQDLAVLRDHLEGRARRSAAPAPLLAAIAEIERERRDRIATLRPAERGRKPAVAGGPEHSSAPAAPPLSIKR